MLGPSRMWYPGGSYLVSEAVVGVLGSIDLVTKYIAIDAITEHEIVMTCGAIALIGGFIFGRYHDALIDTALGLLGGALVAQGGITMALADVIDAELAQTLKVRAATTLKRSALLQPRAIALSPH